MHIKKYESWKTLMRSFFLFDNFAVFFSFVFVCLLVIVIIFLFLYSTVISPLVLPF
jgi:hypothetical protein